MGRNTDLQDELRRAEAHERELQRRLGMEDGISRPRSDNYSSGFSDNGFNAYGNAFDDGLVEFADEDGCINVPDGAGGFIRYQVSERQVRGKNVRMYKQVYRTSPNPKHASVAFKVLGTVFILSAIVLLLLMWLVVDSMRAGYSRCTQQVQATVIRNEKGSEDTYFPVFEYEVDGMIYTQKSHSGRNPPKYQLGDKVTIHYDPTNPNGFYVEKEDMIVIGVMTSISGLFMLLGVIFVVVSVKKKRQADNMLNLIK